MRFETELYPNATEDLVDGRVLGRAIVPMSAFITMAARLSRALGLGDVCQVTAMTLPVPLVVSALGLTVQTVATPQDDGWHVRVYGRSPETDWEEHGAFTLAGGAAVSGTAPTATADATRADGVGANAAAVTILMARSSTGAARALASSTRRARRCSRACRSRRIAVTRAPMRRRQTTPCR